MVPVHPDQGARGTWPDPRPRAAGMLLGPCSRKEGLVATQRCLRSERRPAPPAAPRDPRPRGDHPGFDRRPGAGLRHRGLGGISRVSGPDRGAGPVRGRRTDASPDYRQACTTVTRPGVAHCLSLIRTNVAHRAQAALGPDAAPVGVGYGPTNLQSAYNLPSPRPGAGRPSRSSTPTTTRTPSRTWPSTAPSSACRPAATAASARSTRTGRPARCRPRPAAAAGPRRVARHRHGLGDLPELPHPPGRGQQRRPSPTSAPP